MQPPTDLELTSRLIPLSTGTPGLRSTMHVEISKPDRDTSRGAASDPSTINSNNHQPVLDFISSDESLLTFTQKSLLETFMLIHTTCSGPHLVDQIPPFGLSVQGERQQSRICTEAQRQIVKSKGCCLPIRTKRIPIGHYSAVNPRNGDLRLTFDITRKAAINAKNACAAQANHKQTARRRHHQQVLYTVFPTPQWPHNKSLCTTFVRAAVNRKKFSSIT
jgi:hypothetical protein